jgi:hypothetical protein
MTTDLHGRVQPERIWLTADEHSGEISWTTEPMTDDDDFQNVAYVRADLATLNTPAPTTEMVDVVREAIEAECFEVGFRLRKPAGDKLARAVLAALNALTTGGSIGVDHG